MNASYHTVETYTAKTERGHEVETSGFNRVCPRCGKQWTNKVAYLHDNTFLKTDPKDMLAYGRGPSSHPTQITIYRNVYMHNSCGGETLLDRTKDPK
jgi:hypothetical protein